MRDSMKEGEIDTYTGKNIVGHTLQCDWQRHSDMVSLQMRRGVACSRDVRYKCIKASFEVPDITRTNRRPGVMSVSNVDQDLQYGKCPVRPCFVSSVSSVSSKVAESFDRCVARCLRVTADCEHNPLRMSD